MNYKGLMSMDIKNRKTTLDDSASIYQKREKKSSKEYTSSMTKAEKWQYFKDYYLKIVIAAAICLVLAGSFIYSAVFNRSEAVFSIAFLNDNQLADTVSLEEAIKEYFDITAKNQYIDIQVYTMDNMAMSMKFSTMMAAGAIDLVVADPETFQKYADQDVFLNLSEHLDSTDSVMAPYGVPAAGTEFYELFGGVLEEPYVGIMANAIHGEEAEQFLADWLIP